MKQSQAIANHRHQEEDKKRINRNAFLLNKQMHEKHIDQFSFSLFRKRGDPNAEQDWQKQKQNETKKNNNKKKTQKKNTRTKSKSNHETPRSNNHEATQK